MLFGLTDLLTRLCETGETEREADDSRSRHPLLSGTRRNVGDEEDVRRSAHNPEVAGSNPAPATWENGLGSIVSGAVFGYL